MTEKRDVPVVSSSDVAVLNTAITQLVSRTAPPARPVTMLYDRWKRFAESPVRQRSDVELEPVLRAFAVAYRAVAKGRVEDVDGRITELASGEPIAIELAGKQLDQALARVGQPPGAAAAAPWYKNPLVLIGGSMLAMRYFGKKKGGKRK